MKLRANLPEAIKFLKNLRPSGPWVLTAIEPDGATTTITATTTDEVCEFIREHDGKRNIYYTLNPNKTAMSKKPKKTDIAAAEFVHADLDPGDDESLVQAHARGLPQYQRRS